MQTKPSIAHYGGDDAPQEEAEMRRVWKGKQRAMDGDDEVIADSEDEDVKRAVREAVPQELERLEMKKEIKEHSHDGVKSSSVALPTPAATPFATTSSFAFASPPAPALPQLPPASPLTPPSSEYRGSPRAPSHRRHSPSPVPRLVPFDSSSVIAPLDRLFPAGTILLPQHSLDTNVEHSLAEDGWISVTRDTLRAIPLVNGDGDLHPFPPINRSPAKAIAGKKRKASLTPHGSPSKKAKQVHPLLEALLSMVAAQALRATVRIVGTTAVVRVYLVAQDLPGVKKRGRRPPSSFIFHLLNEIRASEQEWEGEMLEGDAVPLFRAESDSRSLLDLYRDIESPSHDPDAYEGLEATESVKDRLRWALVEGAEGVKTEMFSFQKATLAKMLARELAPQQVPHPSYSGFPSPIDDSLEIFISLDGDVRLAPLTVREPRGGILAEDMGVGKTLIVLSLVLSTLSELPKLDGTSTYVDGSSPSPPPVLLTDISVDFPFAAERDEARRKRPRVPAPLAGVVMDVKEQDEYDAAIARQAEEDAEVETLPLPSLRSLMATHVKISATAIRYDVGDEVVKNTGLLQLLEDSPPFYRTFPSPSQLDSRDGRRGAFVPSSVIVAATTLVVVPTDLVKQWQLEIDSHTDGRLRLLVLRTSKDKFPSPAKLATFDLVLMSVARFSDAAEANSTALREVHWKRLVVDEGHALASGNRMRRLTDEVSGTPTVNLRGVQETQDGALFASGSASRVDLDRLGSLFTLLRHPAFTRPDSLRKLTSSRSIDGQERAARLSVVLDRFVIRHDQALVKKSFTLPPLTSEVVFVESEAGERLIYNALLSLFSSNSTTSQKVDQDYLFHPANLKHLNTLVDNLSTASTFFASTELMEQLHEARRYAKKNLDCTKSWTNDERAQLVKVYSVLQEALDDVEARLTCGVQPSVGIEVENFPAELLDSFDGLSASNNPLGRTLVPQSQLIRLLVDLKELRRSDVKEWDDDEELIEELTTLEDKRKRLDAGTLVDDVDNPLFKKRSKKVKDTIPLAPLPEGSVFRMISLVRTTSAKINHVVGELLARPDEKFIIFCSSLVDIVFANLSETLDLLGLKHLIFAGSKQAKTDRGTIAQSFNSDPSVRVLLVDAKLGGRGFSFVSASRVIFLEPIWAKDLEAQAAKRAWRLGQKRPVHQQTLVVRGTYEHALLQRREQVASEEEDAKVKLPQHDNQLAAILQSAQYLEPAQRAKEGKPVSPAFEGVMRLIREAEVEVEVEEE